MNVTTLIESFAGGILSPTMNGRKSFEKYQAGCLRLENLIPLPQGPVTMRPGFKYVAEGGDPDNVVVLIPFIFSKTQAYMLEFGHEYMRVYMDQGQVLAGGGGVYEIVTPYQSADLATLHYCQSIDVLYVVHPSYAPRKITRTAHNAWTIAALTFGPALAAPTGLAVNLTGTGTGTDHTYVVTTISPDTLEESSPCAEVTDDGPVTLSTTNKMVLTWSAVAGAEEYWVYKKVYGIYSYIGKAGAIASPTYTDDGSRTPDQATTPPDHPASLFGTSNNYPSSVTIYQQRLTFAGTNNEPTGLWFSRSGAYTNFGKSSPVRDDDSIVLVADADQNNAIQWVFPGRYFMFGTAGGEWVLAGGDGGVLTPTSFKFDQTEYNGSENIQPAIAGATLVFLEYNGKRIRDWVYSLEQDGYKTNDLIILSEHLLKGHTIVSWAYQSTPWGVLWMVRDDGVLLGLTYQRDHQVVAWHYHETYGYFESVAVIPGDEYDELWAVVRRTIDGTETRYVEVMADPFEEDPDDARAIDAMFLDCMATYGPVEADIEGASSGNPVVITSSGHPFSSGDTVGIYDALGMTELNDRVFTVGSATATTFELAGEDGSAYSAWTSDGVVRKRVDTITGLTHLAGETVSILTDGGVHPDEIVTSGGVVTLDYDAEVVHIGFPYTGLVEPMPLQNQRINFGQKRRVHHVSLSLYQTLGCKVGCCEDNLETVQFRDDSIPLDQAPPVFTGEKDRIAVQGSMTTDARVVVVQDQPLPFTLVNLAAHMEVGGEP
jgi:hypothetical protein